MNKKKIFAVALGVLAVFAIALAVMLITKPVIKKAVPPADLSPPAIIAKCEAALDEFVPGESNPPQRVCKAEDGTIKAFSSDASFNSEIKPGDNIVISINLADILQKDWTDVQSGNAVLKPASPTRLCFATYPVLAEENMPGYPNFDEGAYNRFYENRAWLFSPVPLFDSALHGVNFVCSRLLYLSEFSQKASFVINIPSEDLLALDRNASDTGTYGVKIVSIPESHLSGISIESILANYRLLPTIYSFLHTIAR